MYKSFRKLLALVLLLTLPLQGLSAVLMPIHCLSDAPHEEAAVGAQHHHQNAGHEKNDKQESHSHATAQQSTDATSNISTKSGMPRINVV